MADSDYKETRRKEILDGTRSWTVKLTGNDFDRFYVEYVCPLHELRDDGLFEELPELRSPQNKIGRVEIEGSVNYELE